MYKTNYALTTQFFQNVFITNHNSKHLLLQSYFHADPWKRFLKNKKRIKILSFSNLELSPSKDRKCE